MPADQRKEIERRYDDLYETYAKPLEPDHTGEYLAVSPEGKTLLGLNLRDVVHRATESFGPGNFIYKIGEKSVGKWR